MASLCLSKTLPIPPSAISSSSSSNITSPFISCRCSLASMPCLSPQQNHTTFRYKHRRPQRHVVVGMAPDEEKLTRRNPLDFPIEWERPKPGRRPDIFPQFSPMKTPLPPPLPYDPPEEDEEGEENKEEEEEDPDKEEPDKQ